MHIWVITTSLTTDVCIMYIRYESYCGTIGICRALNLADFVDELNHECSCQWICVKLCPCVHIWYPHILNIHKSSIWGKPWNMMLIKTKDFIFNIYDTWYLKTYISDGSLFSHQPFGQSFILHVFALNNCSYD